MRYKIHIIPYKNKPYAIEYFQLYFRPSITDLLLVRLLNIKLTDENGDSIIVMDQPTKIPELNKR